MEIKRCLKECSLKGAPEHFQDTQHGKGIRVHNARVGCTVCGDSKYDKLWAASTNAPNSYMHLRFISNAEREVLGHCAPIVVPEKRGEQPIPQG